MSGWSRVSEGERGGAEDRDRMGQIVGALPCGEDFSFYHRMW